MTDLMPWQAASPIRRTGGFVGLPDTMTSVRAAYVRGDIELDEFERRVERLIRDGRDYEPLPLGKREAQHILVRRLARRYLDALHGHPARRMCVGPVVSVDGVRQAWVRMGIPRGWHPAIGVVGALSLAGAIIDTFV